MEIACGILGWTPATFWQTTPHEFLAALDGYLEKLGKKNNDFVGKDRLAELMAQFPDR